MNMRLARLYAPATVALALSVCACSDEGGTTTPNQCEDSPTATDEIGVGLTKAGASGTVQLKLMATEPAKPARGENRWTVQLLDSNGAPQASALVTRVRPWMPDHGHGTSVVPEIGDTDGEGFVAVDRIDFRMPGVWTLTFDVEQNGTSDSATFGVCIDP
jgi:hypothetical protein